MIHPLSVSISPPGLIPPVADATVLTVAQHPGS